MTTIDGTALINLQKKVDALRAAAGAPIHPLPLRTITTLLRGSTVIGYIITPFGSPAPTSATIALKRGTLWIQATLLGTAFSAIPGFAGVPFSSAKLKTTGTVTFSGGNVTLAAAAMLEMDLASFETPVTGPAGDPIGPDFLAAKLNPFPTANIVFAPAGVTIGLVGAGSMTVYGQTVSLTPAVNPTLVNLAFTTPHAAVPCKVTETTFTVAESTSPEVALSGTGPIEGGSVVFPIYNAAAASLPDPTDAWGIAVGVGLGLSALIAPYDTALALAGAAFALTPARLVGLVINGVARARESYQLWPAASAPSPAPPERPQLALPQSQLTFDLGPLGIVAYSADPTQEIAIKNGALTAVLDRPLDASGSRIPLAGPALLTRVHTSASITVDVGSTLTQGNTLLALVGENALIPVNLPNGFLLSGTLTQNTINGGLAIIFPASAIVPTFPDPYAAVYSTTAAHELVAGASATVNWTATTAPVLAITKIGSNPAGAAARGISSFAATDPARIRLLDISSNADQWGVEIVSGADNQFSFSGLVLQTPAADTNVFTVPGISWEGVVDATNAPAWLAAASNNDGIPTTFLVPSTTPTPIVPIAALTQYKTAAGSTPTSANFTLPFGITANLYDARTSASTPGPSYTIPAIAFPDQGLAGARVLSISGAPAPPLEANLPGSAFCGYNATNPAYGAQVLDGVPTPPGPSVASFWDQDFKFGAPSQPPKGYIPVGRIDLSGYGTSLFSDWHDPALNAIGIVRALFNVLLGRTAHEVITAQTWILPWCIRLQRTITFDRSDGGEVVRHDTGWKAVAAGKFEFLTAASPSRLLAGPVLAVNNVRNILFSTASVKVGTISYSPCTFDADVQFASSLVVAADGKNPAPTAVCTAIQGYADDTIAFPVGVTAAEIIALMQQTGRVSGTTGCIARVGGSGNTQFTLRASSIGAAVAKGTTPMLQTALFGVPQLPKDGQWSIAKRPSSSAAPQPVGATTPVPLTQGTSAGSTPPSGPGTFGANSFRLLDPEDAQSVDSPQTFYSILQGTGTSKTLFEHPLVNNSGTGLGFNNVPGLADASALLGVASVFPDIGSVLQIPAAQGGLPISASGFVKTYSLGAAGGQAQPPDRSLLDLGIVHMLLSYAGPNGPFTGQLVLNATPSAPNWSLTLDNLSFKANVDGLGPDPLLTISGGFKAGSGTSPGFTNLQVDYGSALSAVKTLLTGLGDLASDLGGSSHLDVGFTGPTLSVQEGFTLPTIPLGFGEIKDLGLDLGFTATLPTSLAFSVGIGSKDDPFQWIVSPLAGTGAIVLGVQDGGPDVFIEASLGLGLAIDLAVASGSASIQVGLSLDVGPNAITISATLTGKAEVDVLGGLASASLTLTATITVTIEKTPHQADLSAQCSVGIHISILWVINISFDGSWGFSETIALS